MVVAGTVPTVVIALTFRHSLEKAFGSVLLVGFTLVVTGCILVAPRIAAATKRSSAAATGGALRVGLLTALAVGAAQGLAVTPGISRSGTTIAAGLILGLDRDLAGRFSFLLSIPAIIGAVILQFDIRELVRIGTAPLVCGFTTAAVVGFFALKLLMGMVRRGQLHYFAPYCWAVGLAAILFS
jgi:undecaprenyl-diphosphatase